MTPYPLALAALIAIASYGDAQPGRIEVRGAFVPLRTREVGAIMPEALDVAVVGQLTVSPRGTVVVADTRELRLAVFDTGGRQLRIVGRRGSGPGEFQSITGLAWAGDTLIVLDLRQRRLTALLPESGHILSTLRWTDTVGFPVGMMNAGARAFVVTRPRQPLSRIVSTVIIGSTRTVAAPSYFAPVSSRSIGAPRPAPRDSSSRPHGWACEDSKGTVSFGNAFYDWRGPATALTKAGDLVVVDSQAYRLKIQRADTRSASYAIERTLPLRRVTNAEWDSIVRPLQKYAGFACDPPIKRPAAVPFIRAIAIDDRDRVWLEVTGVRGFEMHIVSLDGRPVGQFPMPVRDSAVPWYIRNGRMYFVRADNDGLQSVHVWVVGVD